MSLRGAVNEITGAQQYQTFYLDLEILMTMYGMFAHSKKDRDDEITESKPKDLVGKITDYIKFFQDQDAEQ